jgi:peptidoglycan-associated lipoprotein
MLVVALAAGATALTGCAEDPKPAPRLAAGMPMVATDATPRPAMAPPPRQDTASPTSGSVHIDDRIIKACGDVPEAHFAFDSAAVQPAAAAALDAVAHCFTVGALRGKSLRLIGHTDPRGETEYNLGLGQRRAGSVSEYLSKRGVERSHLTSSSRGEFDATGTDEDGWARDRKVDILLAD